MVTPPEPAASDDSTSGWFIARRVLDWERRDGAVVLQIEGFDRTGDVAWAELTIAVLESGALQLMFGLDGASNSYGLHGLAPLAVTTTEAGLHLASERHAQFGPDPEDVRVEIGMDPLTLAVIDAGGREVIRLAGPDGGPPDGGQSTANRVPMLAWTPSNGDEASAPGMAAISFALEADEHLYGLDAQPGPLDRIGARRVLDPTDGSSHPL